MKGRRRGKGTKVQVGGWWLVVGGTVGVLVVVGEANWMVTYRFV